MKRIFPEQFGFDGVDLFVCPQLDRDDIFTLISALDSMISGYELRMSRLLDDGATKSDLLSLRARKAAALELRNRLVSAYDSAVGHLRPRFLEE